MAGRPDAGNRDGCAGPVFLFVGGVLFLIGAGWGVRSAVMLYDTVRVEGVVTAEGRRPAVAYTAGGQTFTCRGEVKYRPSLYRVGDRVTVRHPAARPADGFLNTFAERWFIVLVFGGTGAVFARVGLGLHRQYLAYGRRPRTGRIGE